MSTLNVTQIKNPSAGSSAITLDTSGNASVPSLVPPGTVQFYAANTAPAGWVKANGAALSRTAYAALFAAVGTTFGVGDGSTTFNLPDLRGEFMRGWADGRSVDTGRAFGTSQGDAMQGHGHFMDFSAVNYASTGVNAGAGTSFGNLANGNGSAYGGFNISGPREIGTTGSPRTASETRPNNIALLAIIKY